MRRRLTRRKTPDRHTLDTDLKIVRDLADVVEVQVLQDLYLAAVVELDSGRPQGRRLAVRVPQAERRQGRETRVHPDRRLPLHVALPQYYLHYTVC